MLSCAIVTFLYLTSSLTLLFFYTLIYSYVEQSIELGVLTNASIRSKTIQILKEQDLGLIRSDLETSGTVISQLISLEESVMD